MVLDIVVVMDPIGSIRIAKDSTFAMLLEAQRRGHRLHYVVPGGLGVRDHRRTQERQEQKAAAEEVRRQSSHRSLGSHSLAGSLALVGLRWLRANTDPPGTLTERCSRCW